MTKYQAIAFSILIASIIGLIAYAWLLIAYTIPVLQLTAFIAAVALASIPIWISWTILTTPKPSRLPIWEGANAAKLEQEKKDPTSND